MRNTPTIGFAVLGLGRMGQRHMSLIRSHPAARLVAVADVSQPDALIQEPFFPNLESLLSSSLIEEIDIVTIATPNGLHAAHACACLEAGKHVVVEKPVALHSADIQKMLHVAQLRNVHVFPVLQNRFAPGAVWLKDLVASGNLGRVFLVQVDCFWNRDERYYQKGSWHGNSQMDGGILFTQFSHFVDLLYWLFGDLSAIRSHFVQGRHWTETNFADTGTVQFRLTGGGIGSLNVSTSVWDKNMESSITLIAENGSVKVGGQHLDRLDYCHLKEVREPFPKMNGTPETNLGKIVTSVIDVLQGRAEPMVRAIDMTKVVCIIESMYTND